MEEGDVGFNAMFQQGVDQLAVKTDARFIHLPGPLGEQAGPGEGKTVGLQPDLPHQRHILPEAVVVVTGRVAGVAFIDMAALVTADVSDTGPPAVLVPGPLDLIGAGGRAPHKILCE